MLIHIPWCWYSCKHHPSKRHARTAHADHPHFSLLTPIPLLAKPLIFLYCLCQYHLVHHNIGVLRSHMLLLVISCLRVVVHLHVVVAATLHLVIFLILAALALDVFRASVGSIIIFLVWTSGVICTGHLLIFALSLDLFFLLEFFAHLLGAVGLLVVVGQVGVGLVGREFGRRALIRVPVILSAFNTFRQAAVDMTHHLMAKRVTLGFSARMLRRTFSMTGFAGGSAIKASSVYSLLT